MNLKFVCLVEPLTHIVYVMWYVLEIGFMPWKHIPLFMLLSIKAACIKLKTWLRGKNKLHCQLIQNLPIVNIHCIKHFIWKTGIVCLQWIFDFRKLSIYLFMSSYTSLFIFSIHVWLQRCECAISLSLYVQFSIEIYDFEQSLDA